MADQPERKVKGKSQTLRQQTQTSKDVKPKKRRLRNSASRAAKPLRKAGRFGRFFVPKYFRNSWAELRMVTWPNRKETRQLTTAVIIFALVFSVLIGITDKILDKLFKEVLLK